ncbi:hypothetical protein Poly51_35100 [Rubripirellula tenax]|uniref:Fe2OG dioxygenase domain-containing protein n=1 Tax=Rubripirellula tenax TaxID=2528015 RepID=A0A5C6F5P2_9BACT|nr:2OG-Fe(II) oxygenase [Rubripirellula tenax]TWU54791.1 hypothetical protein Poly51_35100 [Rubripirellula tenax]
MSIMINDLPRTDDESAFVACVENSVSRENLEDLVAGNVIAIRQQGYCLPKRCESIAASLLKHEMMDGYVVDPRIRRWGGRSGTFYDTYVDPSLLEEYFVNAQVVMQGLREACGFDSPIDRLHAELDEASPAGATVARFGKRKMVAGTAREFRVGVGADPHVDSLGFDSCRFPDAPKLDCQLSANIYLQPAEDGGELEIWPQRITCTDTLESLRDPSSDYGLDRKKLGAPAVRIKPEPGELVLFDTNHPHAVCASKRGVRVTLSLFIGLVDWDSPLQLFN